MNAHQKSLRKLIACSLASVVLSANLCGQSADPKPAEVAAALKHAADWHLGSPSGIDTRDWVIAPLYDGLLRLATTTGDPQYLAAVLRFGTQSGWMADNRIFHADDIAVGHAWLDVYFMNTNRAERLAPMRERLDYIIAHPITEALIFGQKPKTPGVAITDRWTWCDALYMAPPTLTRLYNATGDKKYLEFLDREFRYTYDMLWDKQEKLFFRDATFFDKKTKPGGQKTFWSRGNGWVYGGLCLLLESLPKDHPTRGFYENLFQEMTYSVLAAQQADGLWRPSLLDLEQIPIGETSGSGFFTFGLAWGVNHGLLDREKHWPAIIRAWNGLLTRVKPDGYVGYVQPIGAAPDKLDANSRQDYGTGAFLLAGSEVLRAVGGAAKVDLGALLAAAEQIVAEDKTPRAYARLVPERKDDLAWENDKVAFRVYGPALRAGAEDSGIDVWCKRVSHPILDKWYDADRLQKISYHQDHGEGYDGYHVGNTRGCGGLGLWMDGKLVTSDTYIAAEINWTKPEVAEFKTVYEYPVKIGGKPLYEHRVTRLRLGARFSEIETFFANTSGRGAKPVENFPHEVAIGIVTQNKGAQIKFDQPKGFASVYESLDGKGLGAGVIVPPALFLRSVELPAADKAGKNAQALVITRPDAAGRVIYRAGFAWAGDGEITNNEQWLQFLARQAAR
ncbi:MAG: glycoside hydrolase family 88 protein [Verrucomicrobiota bacterium]